MKANMRVLDAFSLLVYLEGADGSEKMIEIFRTARDSGRDLLLSAVNWGEVYYITLRETGRDRADEAAQIIATLPIQLVPADQELTKLAAELKASHKMSYADCFAAALGKMRRAELVTGDKEFRAMEKEIKILWIR